MYDYRKMTSEERREAVERRRLERRAWHSPPHWEFAGERQFLISVACFEHAAVIEESDRRMAECENALLEICGACASALYAWCLLPNHYHLLVRTDRLKELRAELGRWHGRSAHKWNGEDQRRGRQVWHNCFDRDIRSHRHFQASVNYIHHNAVHHGYAQKWQDWPWSSAAEYLERVGHERAAQLWREYPVLDYGKTWDVD